MLTADITAHLARAAQAFPLLGPLSANDLVALVASELGDSERLDRFCVNGVHGGVDSLGWSRAFPRSPILHIISGNTPHAGLQSLLRGLLVGGHNWCKEPSCGLPELHRFRDLLPPALAERVEISKTLPAHWMSEAEVIVAFGSDATLASIRSQLRPSQRFVAHGHRLSFGLIQSATPDELPRLAELAARDASLYDQQGCLSPHLFYLPESLASAFAPLFADAMARFEAVHPRAPITPEEERDIMLLRETAAFRAALGGGESAIGLWHSQGSTAWTVILAPGPGFIPSCLNRTVHLLTLPDAPSAFHAALAQGIQKIRPHLSSIGIHPFTLDHAGTLATLGASRITPLGQMQFPLPTWHHDGDPVLLPLVRWVDAEPPQKAPPQIPG